MEEDSEPEEYFSSESCRLFSEISSDETQDSENLENFKDEEQVQEQEEEENDAYSEEEEENDTFEKAEAKTRSEEEAEEENEEENDAGSEEVNEYEERLIAACKDVASKIRSIRSASAHHKVPYSTLYVRVKNGHFKQKSAGRPKFLTEDEEKLFASYCIFRAVRACPLTREEILTAIQDSLNKVGRQTKFKNNRPSKKWFNRFKQRHNLSLRKPEELDGGRTRVKQFNIFLLLHKT